MKAVQASASCVLTFGLIILFSASSPAFLTPPEEALPNFDRRTVVDPDTWSEVNAGSLTQMRGLLSDVRIDFDEHTGSPKWVVSAHGFLTGPQGRGRGTSARTIATFPAGETDLPTKAFLKEHEPLFGHGPEILEKARVKREFNTPHSGLKTVVWEQSLDGIAVFDGLLISHTTTNDELVSLSSHFLPDPAGAAQAGVPARAVVQTNPPITAKQAVALAAVNLGEAIDATAVTETEPAATGAELRQRFQADGLNGETEVRLLWLPMSRDSMRLCWEAVLTSRARGEMYRLLIDAETGDALVRHCLTEYLSDASYRIYARESPSPFSPGCDTPCTTQPPVVERVLVTLDALNTNASPNGWIDDGVNETRGNNVFAHTDRNYNDSPDLPRPQGSPFRVFDFPLDLALAPATYTNAAVTDLFYWCNWMHDKLYSLGFTEAAGNFQTANFGRGGLGNDALQADAQDGSGFNNANMATPSDGSAPRMQMFLFSGPTPDRDGDFDHEIVLHEYTHGLSNRRVGGGVGLSALQSRGMGEGWSDWYALTLLSEPGDDVNGTYAKGGYATYLLSGTTQNYYFGIRRYPYSTDLTKNPLTFRDIDPSQASSHPGIPRSSIIGSTADEVHNQGEVWCVVLWEARANLITKHGYATGNELILQLVTDGMNLSPANPNFLQARDAILQADFVNTGGANLGELWAAFAKRGMGYSAASPSSSATTGVVEAFDVPDDLLATPSTGFTSRGPVGGPFSPVTKGFTLVNIGTSPVNWSASSTALWLNLSQSGGGLTPGETNVVNVSLNTLANSLSMGSYTNFVHLTNETSGVVQSRAFVLRVGLPDHFTEWFSAADNDLDHQTLTFTPDGSTNFYSVCREPAAGFPTDPVGGANLSLGAHTYLQLTTPTNVSIYGRSTNVIFLNSEGHLTLVSPDTSGTISLVNHFSRFRVAALLAHLHPIENGGAVSWRQLTNRVALTFSNSWEYGTANYNNFQIELFYDGRIRMTHLSLGTAGGLTGLSRGSGTPAGFLESDLTSYGSCALPLSITVAASATEGDDTLSEPGRVNIFSPAATNVTVTLVSSDTSEAMVPSSVTILAGETTGSFDVSMGDDADLDGVKPTTITASAPGYLDAVDVIQVNDNETAGLNLVVPSSVTEGGGIVNGTVFVTVPPTANIPVALSSSDTTEIQVPPSVILPAGQTSAVFNVTIINDTLIDGTQTSSITAHVPNWTNGSASIMVQDNEPTNLVVALPASAREGNGTQFNAGTVRIGGTLASNLPVALLSSDLSEITVPANALILAGQTVASFSIMVVDDPDIDSSQPVTVTASAAGFTSGSTNMMVTDDESPPEPFNPSPAQLATNVIQTSDLAWSSGALPGEIITNDVYFGTNPTPGPGELLGTTTSTNWMLPNLSPQTIYYWQIVARKTGVTPSPIWKFTTRGVDHFVWNAIASPQHVIEPFAVTIMAKDAFETTVSNFTGTVNLTASGDGGTVTNMILGNIGYSDAQSANYTLAFGFTPNTNMTVTHVRSFSGTKVSIWTDNGALLAVRTVAGTAGTWTETPLATPLSLSAGTTYRVGFYTGGTTYYFNTNRPGAFPNGTVVNGYYYYAGDAFPSTFYNSDKVIFLCDLRYTTGGLSPIPITPAISGAFADGAWTGSLTVWSPSANLTFQADDGSGRTGYSNPLAVELRNDLAVSVTDSPDPVSLGGNVTYTINVTNIGPGSATGVVVTNELPIGAVLVSVNPSQGTVSTNGNLLICELTTLPADSSATITIVATATNAGVLTNRVFVSRAEADAYPANNSVVNTTAVQTPAISINDVSLYEGNAGTSPANFVVSISPAPAFAASVNFTTAGGTAVSPGDFIATNGMLTFAPGETNKTLAVTVIGEGRYETTENFMINLASATNATLADIQAVATIWNDDPIPMLSIGDATVAEGNVGQTNAVFSVSLSSPSGLPVTFYLNTTDGSASSSSDYGYTNSYYSVPAGETTTNVSIWINGDLQIENDEVFYVDLASVSGATLLKREGIGLILNDDGLPENADHFTWEPIASPQYAGQPFGVTITALDAFNNRAVNFSGPANISVSGAGLTNVLGTGLSESAFPMYSSSYAERTQVIYPADELGGPGTINALALDVTSLPYLTLNNWTVRMKHTPLTRYASYSWESTNWTVVCKTNLVVSSTGWLVLPLTTPFNCDGTNSLMIDFSFYNSTTYGSGYCRTTSRNDTRTLYYYTSSYGDPLIWSGSSPSPYATSYTPNVLLIRSGELTAIQPTVTGLFTNGIWSGDITATLPATNAVLLADDGLGHAGASGGFAVQLINDLAVTVVDSPDPVAVGGNLAYALAVTNTGPSVATGVVLTNQLPTGVALVSVAVSQGSYTIYGQTIVCELGMLNGGEQANVNIAVTPSGIGGLTNVATVARTGAEYYTPNNTATNVTVVVTPALAVSDVSVSEPNGGTTNLEFNVTLSVASPQTVTVNYATANVTATAGSDYAATNGSLTFLPGETNHVVRVEIFDDTLFEPIETLSLGLSAAVNANLAKPIGTGSIVDNEGPPEFQINNLLASNTRIVDHDALTSDDRGGVAVSGTHIFVTGDGATARFTATDLTGGASLGIIRDSLCSDLRTEKVYLLGNGSTPLTSSGGTVSSLIELNATGSPTGAVIPLSQTFTMLSSPHGIFSGYGRIVVHNGTRVYDIYVPTGFVTDRGAMARPNMYGSESWASWGVAEYFGGVLYLAFRESGSQRIVRSRVPDGLVTAIATFSDLGDMASFVVSPSRSRWYFHYEGSGQFGGSSETLGYADAQLSFISTNPPTIITQPVSQTALTGGSATFNVGAFGSPPLGYLWWRNGSPIAGATQSSFTKTNCLLTDSGAQFSCLVSNTYGAVTSTVATLTVLELGTFFDDFDPSIDLFQWSGFGGVVGSTVLATNYGGFVSAPNSLWFGVSGSRYAMSRVLDVTLGGVLDFWLRISSGGNSTWEMADLPGEGVVVEYSTNGTSWVEFGRYDTSAYTVWTNITAEIPTAAQTASTRFRWRQLNNSGSGTDHWALDDVAAFIGPRPPVIVVQPISRTIPLGGTASFNVAASGSVPFSYQWRKDGTNFLESGRVSGTASNRLTIINLQTNDAGIYSVLVTNLVGAAVSSNAILTVDIPLPPDVPFSPIPTNLAAGVSVHTLLSWNGLDSGEIRATALGGGYGVIDTAGYDAEALTHIRGLSNLTATAVLWATINSSSGADLLAAYGVIYFSVNASATDYQNLRTAVADGNSLEQFVSLGGTLVLNVAGNSSSQANIGPGGLDYDRTFTHNAETIVAPDHAYATGDGFGGVALTTTMFNNWGSTDHGTLTGLPVAATELLRNAAGTSMFEYSWGAGRVIASTLTFGWSGASSFSGPPYDNELLYAASGHVTETRYDVWFGTNASSLALIATNLTESVCNPGPLTFNTTYFWQVVASNVVGSVTGVVWQFTTTLDEVHFASASYSVGENTGAAAITVVRENPAGGTLSVQYYVTNGTATAGSDYTAVSGTLTLSPGVMSTNFQVTILNDVASEGSETIELRLSQPSTNVLLASPSDGLLTIVDDDALQVSVLFDPSYVDIGTSTGGEATNVIASLQAKGCLVRTFAGITPAAFSNALVGASILYIPDLETGDLGVALSAAARSVISNFVVGGGRLIINGQSANRDENFINQVFGFSILSGASGGLSFVTGAAAGTPFAGGPASLTENSGTYEWQRSSLPTGSLSVYEDSSGLYTTVAVIPRGGGKIIFLAYDWYDGVPRGVQDGGWDEVLRRALLELNAPSVPSISDQPLNQTVAVGQTANFAVEARGTAPLKYQWRKAAVPLLNQTNATLTLLNIQTNNAGIYSVIVTNAYGSVTSSPAALTVVSGPVITLQPASQSLSVGDTANFLVTAIGVAPLSYQWQKSGLAITGSTSASLTLTNIQTNDAGTYSVIVTNTYGAAVSSNATLAVSVSSPCEFPPSGLVSWWAAEGNADDRARRNNGTLVGGVTYDLGKVGQAFNFSGSNTYVSVSASSNLDVGIGSGLTIEGWINPDDVLSTQIIAEWNGGGGALGVHLFHSDSGVGGLGALAANLISTTGGDYIFASSPNLITASNFQHVALTYDKTTGIGRLFHNGMVVVAQNLGVFTPRTTYGLYFGARPSGYPLGIFYKGLMDEVSVYSRALSTTEIQAIFNAASFGKCTNALAPFVVIQPTNRTVFVAANVTFSVNAGGAKPLSYQWLKNGSSLTDRTNAMLALTNVQVGDAGNYSVVVSNIWGTATSSNAVLTVSPGASPVITNQPSPQFVPVGYSASFVVGAAGSPPLSYQWHKDASPLAGETNATLMLLNVQTNQVGDYSVGVSNAFGITTSSNATLTAIFTNVVDEFDPRANGVVYALAEQRDGKILVGGSFSTLSGQSRSNFARFNADGSLDANFNPGANNTVLSLAVQEDGRILVAGNFTALAGQNRSHLGRLNDDGSLDANFNVSADGSLLPLAVQVDGRIVVGGGFTNLGGFSRSHIGRLNADGSVDSSFNPGAGSSVYSIVMQADRKILVGGYFTMLGGWSRNRIGRLNADGTLDTGFNPNASASVYCVAVQGDGKILLGGDFTVLGGQSRSRIGRLNPDGSVDATFNPSANATVFSLAIQTDGKILVGGNFTTLSGQSRNYLGRLNPDGTLDASFNLDANDHVYSVAVQPDGKTLVGGRFTMLGWQNRSHIGRITPTGPTAQTWNLEGSTLTWQRSGAGPEVWRTVLDASTNSVDWVSFGEGTRVAGGWQWTGVALPTNAIARAQGFTAGGYWNGSGGSIQMVELPIFNLPIAPLRFFAPQIKPDGSLQLELVTINGSPITPARAARIQFHSITNSSSTNWTPLGIPAFLTNGVLRLQGIEHTGPAARFIRATETP